MGRNIHIHTHSRKHIQDSRLRLSPRILQHAAVYAHAQNGKLLCSSMAATTYEYIVPSTKYTPHISTVAGRWVHEYVHEHMIWNTSYSYSSRNRNTSYKYSSKGMINISKEARNPNSRKVSNLQNMWCYSCRHHHHLPWNAGFRIVKKRLVYSSSTWYHRYAFMLSKYIFLPKATSVFVFLSFQNRHDL